jgi:hypothetical protein
MLTSNGLTGVLVIVFLGELIGSGAGLIWAQQ